MDNKGMNTVNYEIWCEQLRAKNEALEQQLTQARALLDDAVTHMMLTRTTEAQVYLEMRTFLAQQEEQKP